MGRQWAPKYTDAQREGLIAEVIEHGQSAPETSRRAANGTLRAGLEPFAVPVPTVRDLVARRRRRDQLATERERGPSAVVENTCKRLAAILVREVDKYERAVRNSKPTDPAKLRELARAAKEIATLERTIAPKRPAAAKTAQKGKPKPTGDLIDQLAGETRRDNAPSAETAQQDATRDQRSDNGETPSGEQSERINAVHKPASTQTQTDNDKLLRSARAEISEAMRAAADAGV